VVLVLIQLSAPCSNIAALNYRKLLLLRFAARIFAMLILLARRCAPICNVSLRSTHIVSHYRARVVHYMLTTSLRSVFAYIVLTPHYVLRLILAALLLIARSLRSLLLLRSFAALTLCAYSLRSYLLAHYSLRSLFAICTLSLPVARCSS
jgi:hypothetical protein